MLTASLPIRHVSEFSADVRESLTKAGQRELPSKYLYDEVGSALFEAICVLPEYGLTRADARLLEKYSREIVGRLPSPIQVAELGSGSGKKTRWILEALSRRQRTYYYPIEISPSALAACATGVVMAFSSRTVVPPPSVSIVTEDMSPRMSRMPRPRSSRSVSGLQAPESTTEIRTA